MKFITFYIKHTQASFALIILTTILKWAKRPICKIPRGFWVLCQDSFIWFRHPVYAVQKEGIIIPIFWVKNVRAAGACPSYAEPTLIQIWLYNFFLFKFPIIFKPSNMYKGTSKYVEMEWKYLILKVFHILGTVWSILTQIYTAGTIIIPLFRKEKGVKVNYL